MTFEHINGIWPFEHMAHGTWYLAIRPFGVRAFDSGQLHAYSLLVVAEHFRCVFDLEVTCAEPPETVQSPVKPGCLSATLSFAVTLGIWHLAFPCISMHWAFEIGVLHFMSLSSKYVPECKLCGGVVGVLEFLKIFFGNLLLEFFEFVLLLLGEVSELAPRREFHERLSLQI